MLFQQVSESLPMDYLKPSIEQYTQNQFFAGMLALACSGDFSMLTTMQVPYNLLSA